MPCGKVTGLLRPYVPIADPVVRACGLRARAPGIRCAAVAEQKQVDDQTAIGARLSAPADTVIESDSIAEDDGLPELFPYVPPAEGDEQPQESQQAPNSLDDYAAESQFAAEPAPESDTYFSNFKWLGLKHSSTDGRNAGIGVPLVGTSWLNRPYYVGADLGTVWVTRPIELDITTDIDMYGGLYAGCDWDYYWGTEVAWQRATPELINEEARDSDRGDRMVIWSANMMYYPWGDSVYRPYWRLRHRRNGN